MTTPNTPAPNAPPAGVPGPADAELLREVATRMDCHAGCSPPCLTATTAARLRALAAWVTKAEERLTWMAHFADDPAGMSSALTLHYDLTGEAKQLLADLRSAQRGDR